MGNQLKFICCILFAAKVSVRVPSNTGVVEGEKLTITCIVAGTLPTVEWVHGEFVANFSISI